MTNRDPISLQPIRTPFILYRNGTHIFYDAYSLASYVLSSGDTKDPISRQEMVRHEMMRLSRLSGIRLPSIDLLRVHFSEEIERRQMLTYLTDSLVSEDMFFEVLDDIYRIAREDDLIPIRLIIRRHSG